MTTIIRSPEFQLTSAVRAHLIKRIDSNLKRFQKKISLVEVYIEDLGGQGPHENTVKVIVEVGLHDMDPVTVSMTSYEPFSAINIAAKRARRALKRVTKRHGTVEHYGLKMLAGYGTKYPALESG